MVFHTSLQSLNTTFWFSYIICIKIIFEVLLKYMRNQLKNAWLHGIQAYTIYILID